MSDLLPAQIGVWQQLEATLREAGRVYGYREIRTPIVEKTELFTQSIGDHTDIVEKEMYVFTDRGGENLALRPEATASTVRACNQHGLLHNQQQRIWYMGPMFRRERPQKGRYRQFHQFGIEAFGWQGPDIDAEVIRFSASIWARLRITGVKLQINTLGSPKISATYRNALQAYFRQHQTQLDADSQRRLDTNPLRILDSKVAATLEIAAGAPNILSFLDTQAGEHFDGLCQSLENSGIEFAVNPHLVRGLDYYTGTVFEWVSGELGAQNAVCAGGRYDQLVEMRGGRPTPAVGFAVGLERVVDLLRAQAQSDDAAAPGDNAHDGGHSDIYVVSASDTSASAAVAERVAVDISEKLRSADFSVTTHCGGGRLKKQMKHADASGASLAVIIGLDDGSDDDGSDYVQVKLLREQSVQQSISIAALVDWCRHNLQRRT